MSTGWKVRCRGAVGERVFDPLLSSHPLVGPDSGWMCHACNLPFHAGDRVVLVPLGPGLTDQSIPAQAGAWYDAVAIPIHASCAGHDEDCHLPLPSADL